MISSLKRPAFCAASVFCWLASANWSCSSRVTSYSFATFSAVTPMWYWLYTSHRPSTIIVSTSLASPMRKPSREPFSACGAMLIDSWPPATTTSASPWAIACAPSIAACRPEPHTLLMVMAAGRSLDRFVPCVAGARGRFALAAAVAVEPFRPARPPAALVLAGLREPRFRLLGVRGADPVAAPVLRRGIHHARDVPARAEDEGLVLTAHEMHRAIRRAPGNDVVLARREA